MNIKALQRADRWLGIPLCFLLTIVRSLFGVFRAVRPEPPRSLLFIKLAEQGSTVLAYRALKRAVEIVGRENAYFITFEDNRFILDVLDVVPPQNVLTVSTENLAGFLSTMFAAIHRLRRLKLDAAVDLEFFSRGSAALTYLAGAQRRIGFHAFFGAGPYRGNLMTHRLLYNPHLHTTQTFLTLVEAVLCDPGVLPTFNIPAPMARTESDPPQFVPELAEIAQVREMLGEQARDRRPLILLNPNSSDLLPLRRWPIERYVELACRLLAKYQDAVVVLTGAPSEAGTTVEFVRQIDPIRCISLAGKTTLRQLLVLYTLADVLVTNDSGPAHFATLTPVRVVTLFGPETPELFAAQTPRNTVLWAKLPCSPCVNAYNNRQSPCRNNVCMKAITVEEVFEAVCRVLEEKGMEGNVRRLRTELERNEERAD